MTANVARFGSRNGSQGSQNLNTSINTLFGPSNWNVHDFLQKNEALQSLRQNGGGFKLKKDYSSQPKVQCQIYSKLGHPTNKCFQLLDLVQGQ